MKDESLMQTLCVLDKHIYAKCKKIALGLASNVPIYILLDILKCGLIWEVERNNYLPCFNTNWSRFKARFILKYLQNNGLEKRLVELTDQIGKLVYIKLEQNG